MIKPPNAVDGPRSVQNVCNAVKIATYKVNMVLLLHEASKLAVEAARGQCVQLKWRSTAGWFTDEARETTR